MIKYEIDDNNFLTGNWAEIGFFNNYIELEEPLVEPININLKWDGSTLIEDINPEYLKKIYNKELQEIKIWFEDYDKQVSQYNRSLRLNETYEPSESMNYISFPELDNIAKDKVIRVRELKQLLDNLS